MARIKIKDLSRKQKVSKEDMRKIIGGSSTLTDLESGLLPTMGTQQVTFERFLH